MKVLKYKFSFFQIYFLILIANKGYSQNFSLYNNDSLVFQSFDHSHLILKDSQPKLLDGKYNVYSQFDSSKLVYCFNVKNRIIEGAIFEYVPPSGSLRTIVIYENRKLRLF